MKADFAIVRGENVAYYKLQKVRAKRNPTQGPLARFRGAKWQALTNGRRGVHRAWNPELREYDKRSGVYVLRDRTTKTVLYVGESHTDRLYRTLLRHFHDSSGKFEKLSEWVHHAPERLEVLVFPTTKGEALELETEAVSYYEPLENRIVDEIDPEVGF